MKNSDKKPGVAAADRARERTDMARARYQDLARRLFPDFDEHTQPRIKIVRQLAESVPAPSIPLLNRVPKPYRKYVVGIAIGLALAGALRGEDLVRLLLGTP